MEKLIDQQLSGRVIVPVYSSLINNQDLSQAIYTMTEKKNFSVLYLVIADDGDDMLEVSRDMATMKAVTAANKLSVDVMTIKNDDWMDVLREIANPNDIIVCRNEQTLIDGCLNAIPLTDYLSNNLNLPDYILEDVHHRKKARLNERLLEVTGDLGFLIILAVFTWFQVIFVQSFSEKQAQIFIYVSFVIEVASIWTWYKFIFK